MKAKSTTWIAFILVVLSATNCTIEKRLFQPGYSIEWKKKTQRNSVETENQTSYNEEPDTTTIICSSNSLSSKPDHIPTSELTQSISEPLVSIVNLDTQTPYKLEKQESDTLTPQKKAIDLRETEDKKELELFGVMSFGLYFCSVIFAILAVFVFNLPVYLFAVAGFMILLSLIFGIISVDKYRRDKSKYYRNFFGYFGLIASVVTISLVIGFLILASELGSF
nr:hypothetical protein [uncultured Fluviicola sp.]